MAIKFEETERLFTTEEAKAFVKRTERIKGSRFMVHLHMDAHVVDKPDHVFPGGCHTSLMVSRADALNLVSNMLSETMEAKGGRIRITESHMLSEGLPPVITFWIG